jgi:parallel beta-helix repeat protein
MTMTTELITNGQDQETTPKPQEVKNALLTSTPINIDGIAQLQSLATSGNGSSGNPYIIEDYYISNLGTGENGVTIRNINKYFILKNITVESCSDGTGFFFKNVTFGSIIDSSATSNRWGGFRLYSSSNNTLTGNDANNNSSFGFFQDFSSNNNNLTSNNASNNHGDGFHLWSSSNNTLTNNNASNNRGDGFHLWSSSNNTLTNNNASNNSLTGFFLEYSSNNILESNTGQYNQECDYHDYQIDSSNILIDNTFYTICTPSTTTTITPSTTTTPIQLLGFISAISLLIILRRSKN